MNTGRTFFRIAVVSLFLLVPFLIWFSPSVSASIFGWIWFLSPLWLPFILFAILAPLWILYVRSQYVSSIRYTVLELKPGDETPKTPKAMELIFYSLYHRTEVTKVMAILVGQVRLPWSFDVVSHAGTVRFFMRIPTAHRQAIESRFRSEYRDIDIDEVNDYARELNFSPHSMRLKAREYKFLKPDPYPVKTYEEYEQDKTPKDPFLELLERLVAIDENEHFFISYIIRPHQRDRKRVWQDPVDTLHKDASHEIEKLVGAGGDINDLTENKKNLVKAIEAALKKPSFDCGIRAMYIAEKNSYKEDNVQLLETLFNEFEATDRNALTAFELDQNIKWPMSDIFTAIPWLKDVYLYNLYKRRAYFSPPYYGQSFVLNTAELATMYHLPYITRASALARGRGKRLEPPENLPV